MSDFVPYKEQMDVAGTNDKVSKKRMTENDKNSVRNRIMKKDCSICEARNITVTGPGGWPMYAYGTIDSANVKNYPDRIMVNLHNVQDSRKPGGSADKNLMTCMLSRVMTLELHIGNNLCYQISDYDQWENINFKNDPTFKHISFCWKHAFLCIKFGPLVPPKKKNKSKYLPSYYTDTLSEEYIEYVLFESCYVHKSVFGSLLPTDK